MKSILPKNLLKGLKAARRIVIVGVGNPMKGDDGLGAMCAELIYRGLLKNPRDDLKVIIGGEVPENYTGKIRSLQPTHVLIIDACASRKKPGSVFLVDEKMIKDQAGATHQVPLSMLVKYIRETMHAGVIIVGVEPKSLDWGKPLSTPVKVSITTLARALLDTLPKVLKAR